MHEETMDQQREEDAEFVWDDIVNYEVDFDEETLLQLEHNDHTVGSLFLNGSYWTEQAGSIICDSHISHLKITVSVDVSNDKHWRDELFSELPHKVNQSTKNWWGRLYAPQLSSPCSLL
jgi:hypothetical protein